LRELGWHVEVHAAIDELPNPGPLPNPARVANSRDGLASLERLMDSFDVPVVIDHMGRPAPGRTDPSTESNRRLIALVGDGRCYVKLSAPYRLSAGAPPWRDVSPLARALLDADPARCLWASDWPHTSTPGVIRENDLFEALDEWCPDSRTRRTMMEEAPRTLFAVD
jgi:predicted TIM-barrel fold metal-dependent hydrolase